MRVLLDECVPRPLRREVQGHEVFTVEALGLKGLQNGALLQQLIQHKIDVLLTVDRNLPYQQNLQAAGVAVVIMKCRSNRLEALLPLVPSVLAALQKVQPGECLHLP